MGLTTCVLSQRSRWRGCSEETSLAKQATWPHDWFRDLLMAQAEPIPSDISSETMKDGPSFSLLTSYTKLYQTFLVSGYHALGVCLGLIWIHKIMHQVIQGPIWPLCGLLSLTCLYPQHLFTAFYAVCPNASNEPQLHFHECTDSEQASGGIDTTAKSSLSGMCCLALIDSCGGQGGRI